MSEKIPDVLIGTIVVVSKGNKILLGKRKNSYKAGFYGIPGGRVNEPEKLVDTAKRELFEETGIKVDDLEYIGVIRDQHKGYTFTHFAFLCKNPSEEPKNLEPNKCEGWKWFHQDKIPDQTLLSHIAAIDLYVKPNTPRLRDISSN